MKKSAVLGLVSLLVVGMMAFSFADSAFGPAGVYASLTDVTAEEAYALNTKSGDTFGDLAKDAGVYDAFYAATLAAKQAMIEERVKAGTLTRDQADEILTALANCDGTQSRILQSKLGLGQRLQNGQGSGERAMNGSGLGAKNGNGRWQTGN